MKTIIFILLSLLVSSAMTKEMSSFERFEIEVESIVKDYSINVFLLGNKLLSNKHLCDEDSQDPQICMKFMCDRLGTFGCDSRTELSEVASMCRGIRGDKCMSFICGQLGVFGCDSKGELEKVASMCKQRVGGKCMRFICDKLGAFGCDSTLELERVSASCQGVRGDNCLTYTCDRLGSFGCDSFSELSQVATSCAGRN